ncbi:ribosomal RNA processing protein 1 homolog [Salvia hispanica]|uniref:ribosomal RNA processing protein 1 homolog n=1 Tax=Salvia hispanica TaxID=49212 RepID=UPI0020099B17|nr:ribosomal RNA processing protein 1 homolog [Salvia hispanica]
MKKRSREPKPLIPALAAATGPTLIKHLASCSTSVRSQSLRLLQSWLAAQSQQLSDSDVKKLWKGLFYCLWHADKTPNQVALIDRLISLFHSLQPAVSLEFFRGFLVTLRREWPGIDRLRLDKFYLLIRRFVKALFGLMRLRKWDLGVLREYFGVLESDALLADDNLQGNGVNYHLASVFLEELAALGFPVQKEVVDVILGPFFAVLMRGTDKILLGKVKSNLFDELVKAGTELLSKKKLGEGCDESKGTALLGVVALKMCLSGKLYEVTSSVDCIQGNRKVVLGLHEQFLKLEKELESSGIEICIPEYNEDDDTEVPQLIPVDFEDNVDGGSQEGTTEDVVCDDQLDNEMEKKKRKSKKAKKGKDGDDKKKKKKKRKGVENKLSDEAEQNGDLISGSENMELDSGSGDILSNCMENELNETVILNLQKQFEKVAAEMDPESGDDSDSSPVPAIAKKPSKRAKRAKVEHEQELGDVNTNETADSGDHADGKSAEKSCKKVRFSMKNNLVWKPQTPLPPESLRLPPSVTPRGSALKKGVPPGPVVEMPPAKKKAKKKKAQNRLKARPSTMIKKRKRVQPKSS